MVDIHLLCAVAENPKRSVGARIPRGATHVAHTAVFDVLRVAWYGLDVPAVGEVCGV